MTNNTSGHCVRGQKTARHGCGERPPERIANFTLINGCTKSARIAGQIRNDASGSRLSLLYSTLAELGEIGASVWSRSEKLGDIGLERIFGSSKEGALELFIHFGLDKKRS